MKKLHQAILLLKKIPKGKVVSYKEMARVCGTSPRAVGRIMAGNKHPKDYPCYKVVASDGSLQGYSGEGGIAAKRKLLLRDGIRFEGDKVKKECFFAFGKYRGKACRRRTSRDTLVQRGRA